MNRRSFLQTGTPFTAPGAAQHERTGAGGTNARDKRSGAPTVMSSVNAGDLTPYTPRPDKPWDVHRAGHLLRRIGFSCTWEEITAALAVTPAAIVDAALAVNTDAPFTKSWTSEALPSNGYVDNTTLQRYYGYARDLQEWWVGLMLQPAVMLREKMVLFWHNHFVSDIPKVQFPHFLLAQNQLFRQNAFGNFKDLTKKVTVDQAMLIYLDGNASKRGNPNENYARELMELFTLGVGASKNGTPHYTEHDIVELARALTGWSVAFPSGATTFNSNAFDSGTKAIFGTTDIYGIQGHGGADVIDLIFDRNDPDYSRKRAAIFICTKLYQYFVYDTQPNLDVVAAMADTLVANNWTLAPVLRQLLLSEHFMDDDVIGAKMKSPAEFMIGAMHQLKLANPITATTRNNTNVAYPESHDPVTVMTVLSQMLFAPPNVKGWPGGRSWISSATVPMRIRYAQMWIDPIGAPIPYAFTPVDFVKSLPDAKTDVNKMLDHLLELMLPLAITTDARQPLLDELLGGGQPYEWDPDAANAAPRIKACMIGIANLGEYELM